MLGTAKEVKGLMNRLVEYVCQDCGRVKVRGLGFYVASYPASEDTEGAIVKRCPNCKERKAGREKEVKK